MFHIFKNKKQLNILQICDGRDFLAQMLIRSTELSVTTKMSAEPETPPNENVLLTVVHNY